MQIGRHMKRGDGWISESDKQSPRRPVSRKVTHTIGHWKEREFFREFFSRGLLWESPGHHPSIAGECPAISRARRIHHSARCCCKISLSLKTTPAPQWITPLTRPFLQCIERISTYRSLYLNLLGLLLYATWFFHRRCDHNKRHGKQLASHFLYRARLINKSNCSLVAHIYDAL